MATIQNRTKIHQNKYAFAHNPNSKKSARIMAIPNVGLCQRCHDIIEWRKKFRKYKPIRNMTKCHCCQEKKVRSAYHMWCTDCAKASNVCPKCLLNRDIVGLEAKELTQEDIQEMLVQVGMKERVRRKMWRLWENNKVTDEELKKMIFDYNPDSKDEPADDDDEEENDKAPAAAATAPVARGPPTKPKSSPAAASSSSSSAPSAKQPSAADDDEAEEDDDDDYFSGSEEDDEEDEDAKLAAELERQRAAAAKRGPPPKIKRATPAAASSTSSSSSATDAAVSSLTEAVASTSVSEAK